MALVQKYTYTFNDVRGRNYTLKIYKEGHSGGITTLAGMGSPPIVTEMKNNLLDPIKSVTAYLTFNSITSFMWAEFWSADAFDYKIVLSITGSSITVFTGYNTRGVISEPYDSINYPVTVAFNDGLGLLKDIPYDDGSGGLLRNHAKITGIIADILNNIGDNTFDFYTGQFLQEDSLDTADYDHWGRLHIDRRKFRTLNNTKEVLDRPWSCYEVLEEILKAFVCEVRYYRDEWYITQIPYHLLVEDAAYGYTQYNSSGVLQSEHNTKDWSLTIGNNKALNYTGDISNHILTMLRPFDEIKITHELDYMRNTADARFIDDDEWSSGQPRGWTPGDTGVGGTTVSKVTRNGETWLKCDQAPASAFVRYIDLDNAIDMHQADESANIEGHRFIFSFTYMLEDLASSGFTYTANGDVNTGNDVDLQVRIQILRNANTFSYGEFTVTRAAGKFFQSLQEVQNKPNVTAVYLANGGLYYVQKIRPHLLDTATSSIKIIDATSGNSYSGLTFDEEQQFNVELLLEVHPGAANQLDDTAGDITAAIRISFAKNAHLLIKDINLLPKENPRANYRINTINSAFNSNILDWEIGLGDRFDGVLGNDIHYNVLSASSTASRNETASSWNGPDQTGVTFHNLIAGNGMLKRIARKARQQLTLSARGYFEATNYIIEASTGDIFMIKEYSYDVAAVESYMIMEQVEGTTPHAETPVAGDHVLTQDSDNIITEDSDQIVMEA